MTDLKQAAQAVLDRWDSPSWTWTHSYTGELMHTLRLAIDAQPEQPAKLPFVQLTTEESQILHELVWEDAQPALPADNNLRMRPMEGEDGSNGWYIDSPSFYCEIERPLGGQYSVFIRSKDGAEGFAEMSQPVPPVLKTKHSIAHSLAGFRGGFASEHGRKPTEQEIWNHAILSWRDLNRERPAPPATESKP